MFLNSKTKDGNYLKECELGEVSLPNEITCIYSEEEDLYVGDSKGSVILYNIEKTVEKNENTYKLNEKKRIHISGKKRGLGFLSSSKGVQKILTDKMTKLAFIQFNDNLYVYDLKLSRMIYHVKESKNLTTFELDENHNSPQKGCKFLMVVNEKLFFVYYTETDYKIFKNESLVFPERVNMVKWFDNTLIIGFKGKKKYVKIDILNNNKSEDLVGCLNPYLVVMGDEVLLKLQATGVLINLNRSDPNFGMMGRGTIHFTDEPDKISAVWPFMAGLIKNKNKRLEVRTLYDRDYLQSITLGKDGRLFPSTNVKSLGVFYLKDGKLFILSPVPLKKQIKNLMSKGNFSEALELFDKNFDGELKERKRKRNKLLIKCGGGALVQTDIEKAEKFLKNEESVREFDVRDLLLFFIDELDLNYDLITRYERRYFKNETRTLREIYKEKIQSDKKKLSEDDLEKKIREKMEQAKKLLLSILKMKRKVSDSESKEQMVIDNTIALLSDFQNLESFLEQPNNCTQNEMKSLFEKRGTPILYAILLKSKKLYNDALNELERLHELFIKQKDEYSLKKLVTLTVSILIDYGKKNEEIIFHHASWVFKIGLGKHKSQKKQIKEEFNFYLNEGLKIFTHKRTPCLTPEKVLNFFSEVMEKEVVLYERYRLKFLVTVIEDHGDMNELYHNDLALLYITLIENEKKRSLKGGHNTGFSSVPGNEPGNIGKYRSKLLSFLEQSNLFDKNRVLQRLGDTKLYHEQCTVYKKLNKHEEALRIILLKLKDVTAAERYCSAEQMEAIDTKFVEDHRALKSKRFEALLKLCFEEKKIMMDFSGIVNRKNSVDLIDFALTILNKYSVFFDLISTIKVLPKEVKLSQIREFMENSMRKNQELQRKRRIDVNLMRTHFIETKTKLIQLQTRYFVHNNKLKCKKCKKSITSNALAVYPDFSIVHYKCRNKTNEHVDPIKQRNFRIHPI